MRALEDKSHARRRRRRRSLTALGRITKEHKDTSRDPRMAILNRLQAYGDASQAVNLEGYLKDFDPAIAQQGRGDPDRVDRQAAHRGAAAADAAGRDDRRW